MPEKMQPRVRIGVPWRTTREEAANKRSKMENYLRAVERAGGEPHLISLANGAADLARAIGSLDAFVLTGSPADLDPSHFGAKRHPATADADIAREQADFAILEHALAAGKPVLAICYGVQSLNVFLGGSLVQDIPSELGSKICHSPEEDEFPNGAEVPDPVHDARFEAGRVSELAGVRHTDVNSSHHQSVLEPGRGLRVTAYAPDGVVEAVEWTEDATWVVGVQWHPERMPEDPLAQSLFRNLISAASRTRAIK